MQVIQIQSLIRTLRLSYSRLKFSCRTVFVVLLFIALLFFMLWGTLVRIDEAKEILEWENMFPKELPPLNYDPDINEKKLKADDPELLSYLRKRFLNFPPPMSILYQYGKFNTEDLSSSINQTLKLFYSLPSGFFVDVGAYDGVTNSVTLALERLYRWTGLLIEPDPQNFKALSATQRNAYLSNSCLANTEYARVVSFKQEGRRGRTTEWPIGGQYPCHVDVQCFPLLSYVTVLNRTSVDLLHLDVGGGELQILQAIPWDRLDIKVVEVRISKQQQMIRELMEKIGYRIHNPRNTVKYVLDNDVFIKLNVTLE